MTQSNPATGDYVRIKGGLLSDPMGRGILHETPGPLPTSLEGTIGVLISFGAKNEKNFCVIRPIDGPLKDRLLNGDLLFFEIISPLEALAAQYMPDQI